MRIVVWDKWMCKECGRQIALRRGGVWNDVLLS